MKEYATWEVVQPLTSDGSLKFELTHGTKGAYVTDDGNGNIVWKGRHQDGQPMNVQTHRQRWTEYTESPIVNLFKNLEIPGGVK